MLKSLCKSSSMATIFLIAGAVGCQTPARNQSLLSFTQTPPAVQSAFLAYYSADSRVQKIIREARGDQDYYTFTFTDNRGETHEVELNEGGDQIDQR